MVHVRIQQLTSGESFEVLLNGQVIAQHRVSDSETRVTLPEHAQAIRKAARGSRTSQRPRKRFEQIVDPDHHTAVYAAAPVVQTRSLAEYERLLEASA